ncbi:hypothetical protein ACLOJK_038575 [Asimina triloba]
MTRLLKDLDVAKLEQEQAKEAIAELLEDLDVAKVEQDEAVDDVEATILAKQDLELSLEETTVEASIYRLPDQGELARGEGSELSTEVAVARAEVVALCGQVADLGVKEAKLLAKIEASQVETT